MFTVEELLVKSDEYLGRRISLAEFDGWFEDRQDGTVAADPLLRSARTAIDSALSQYYFDDISELTFRKELAIAIAPFQRIKQRNP